MIYGLCSGFSNTRCWMGNGRLLSGSTGLRQWRDAPNRLVNLTGDLSVPPIETVTYEKVETGSFALTSTCIQTPYFLQMSEMAMRGSKAPYTVVPAVALTKKGTKP